METIKDYIQSVPFIGWVIVVCLMYLSVFVHKVFSKLKETRGM